MFDFHNHIHVTLTGAAMPWPLLFRRKPTSVNLDLGVQISHHDPKNACASIRIGAHHRHRQPIVITIEHLRLLPDRDGHTAQVVGPIAFTAPRGAYVHHADVPAWFRAGQPLPAGTYHAHIRWTTTSNGTVTSDTRIIDVVINQIAAHKAS